MHGLRRPILLLLLGLLSQTGHAGADTGLADTAPGDTGGLDTATADTAGLDDGTLVDDVFTDGVTVDNGTVYYATPVDTGSPRSAANDTASMDTAAADTASADTGSVDTATADTALADTAPADTASADTAPPAPVDADADGIDATLDCDDADPSVGLPTERYHDRDADGFGGTAADACPGALGFVDDATDCDDTDTLINPAALESCDGVDNDCDGLTDDASAVDPIEWHLDADDDHFGDAAFPFTACDRPDGYTSGDTDCDDTDAAINPDATEICNGLDDNCDGLTDDSSAADTSVWYADADGDTYGDPASSTEACVQPEGYVTDATDCDDVHASVGPPLLLYRDHDGDTFGDPSMSEYACPQVADHVADNTDCDDYDATIWPGADDPPDDGIDQNCDGIGAASADTGDDDSAPTDTSDTSGTSGSGSRDPGTYQGSTPCECGAATNPSWALAFMGIIGLLRRRAPAGATG